MASCWGLGVILVTFQLLWRDIMTKATYRTKGLWAYGLVVSHGREGGSKLRRGDSAGSGELV